MLETIRNYDMAVGQGEFEDVGKSSLPAPSAMWKERRQPSNVDTYDLKNTTLRIRLMAPTHHTMGGVEVDTERHVLDTEGTSSPACTLRAR